jgi:mRNA interferase MazF
MVRGEIWWAQLPRTKRSKSAKYAPVLVVQGDSYNQSRINTVICAVITSNIELASLPGYLLLEKSISGLDKPSVINFLDLKSLDKPDLIEHVTMLPKFMLEKVDSCLKMVLEIK